MAGFQVFEMIYSVGQASIASGVGELDREEGGVGGGLKTIMNYLE